MDNYSPNLKSILYQAAWYQNQYQLVNQEVLVQKQDRNYQRAKSLFDGKSIAFAEYDEVQIHYQQANMQLELTKKQRFNQ